MGVLANIDDTLALGDNIAQIKYEETLLPKDEKAFLFFKKTYLDTKDIWLYEYRFECPGILKKFNDKLNDKMHNFNGFDITIAVCCNSINHSSLRNCARVTCTLEITNDRGYKMILNQHETTYAPRANFEVFADSLFRIKLAYISTRFADVDSLYDYLNNHDNFIGYKLV